MLLCSGEAVVMAEDRAFGRWTLHTAVELRRPVISPACPAVEELAALGGAVQIDGAINPDTIAAALKQIDLSSALSAFEEFEQRHSDMRVANALGAVYQAAGLELECPSR